MDLLTKVVTRYKLNPDTEGPDHIIYFVSDTPADVFEREHPITRERWEAFGKPDYIDVTVEPVEILGLVQKLQQKEIGR